MNDRINSGRRRGITMPQSQLQDWENDPEYQSAVRQAKALGALVPSYLDWAQYKAEKAREGK